MLGGEVAMSDSHGNPLPDEPKTPMWLPAIGAVLFLTVGMLWGLSPSSSTDAAGGAAAAAPGSANAADAGKR
jgi:hypothetical protein